MILEKLKSYLYDLEAMNRNTINHNDIFHPAPTKMKKFRKGNKKKKKNR